MTTDWLDRTAEIEREMVGKNSIERMLNGGYESKNGWADAIGKKCANEAKEAW